MVIATGAQASMLSGDDAKTQAEAFVFGGEAAIT
jgi:hypothetical protein